MFPPKNSFIGKAICGTRLLPWPQLLVYLMSFLTLGIFWVGQQTQLNHLAHSERHFTWIHLAFLFIVTIMPFSTRLLIESSTSAQRCSPIGPTSSSGPSCTSVGGVQLAQVGQERYAAESRGRDLPPYLDCSIVLRVWRAAVRVPPYWSIGFIVLFQLYYAIAPRYGRGQRSEVA